MAKRLLGVDGVAAHMIPGLVRRELYLHHGTRLIDPRGVVLLCLGTSCSSNSVELCSHSSNRRHWFHRLCSCFISRNQSTTNWVSFSCFFFWFFFLHVSVCALCFPSVGWRCFCLFICLFSLPLLLLLLHESLENGFWKMGFSKSLVI